MTHNKIDPSSPGASSAGCADPHDRISGASGHEGMGREDDGSFTSMSRGGVSEHGDDMVDKYRPGKGSSGKKQFGGSADELSSKLEDDDTANDW